MAFDVNSLGGKLIDNKELKKLIENGGGGSANPLDPFPLFPKATKTTEVIEDGGLQYMGFLFNGLDLSGVNEDTVFKLTIGETSAYYPFLEHSTTCFVTFNGLWVYINDGTIFFNTNELITAEVELDVMPYGFIETFVINGTWGDNGITTDKSEDDFKNYIDKWESKSRVLLMVADDSNYFFKEIIYVDQVPVFINRSEYVSVDGSTNSLKIYMEGYKFVSDNAIDSWSHTFEV